ncbi:ANTAR domain-containing protein [Streptomyces sp. NPDC057616]|uniref:ANTAR domain-containing protein n=1 Tax=Streptomyces sp. NPDC057616 TaxID=3346183 RepID=UPI0036C1D114
MSAVSDDVLLARAVLDLGSRNDGFDVLEMLHDLTAYAVRFAGVHSAGITILGAAGRVDYLTAFDEVCARLEEAQLDLGEGPCMDSARTGSILEPVSLHPGGPGAQRWPGFTRRAVAAGFSAVAAVPVRVAQHTPGALNLLQDGLRPITPASLQRAQVLADAAGACLHHRQSLLSQGEIITQLETALQSRIVIEQAKGALAFRLGIDVQDAFTRMRGHARDRRQKLTDVARQVVQGDIPAELTTVR